MNAQTLNKIFLALSCMLIFSSTKILAETKPREELDRVVAIVNNHAIAESQLAEQLQQIKADLSQRQVNLPSDAELRRQVLNNLINEELVLQVGERHGANISDEQLNQTIMSIAERNNLTLPQFKAALEERGMDYLKYRNSLRRQLLIRELQSSAVMSEIKLNKNDIDQMVKQLAAHPSNQSYHLGEILIALSDAPSPEELSSAQQQARKIRQQLRAGSEFSKLAAAHSSSPSYSSGGDMGWHTKAELPEFITAKLDKLEVGQVTEPIRAANGFYLIKLLATKELPVENQWVRKFHLRQILLKSGQVNSDASIKQRLIDLRTHIIAEQDFAKQAELCSDDKHSAPHGGDLGWVSLEEIPASMARAIMRLSLNQVSEPIQVDDAWAIVEVLDTKDVDNSQELRRAEAINILKQRKFEQALSTWISRLHTQSSVKIIDYA